MKKKIIKISAVSVAVIIAAALLALGAFFLIGNKNVAQTGNLLGVSWYNETDTEFTITTVEEFREIANLSSFYTFEGQTVKLGSDLVFNEGSAADWAKNAPQNKWKPIVKFAGTFDGQGHVISGVYAKAHETQMALFINPDYQCVIQNLQLVNSYFETSGFKGTASFVTGGGGKFVGLYSDAIINHNGENVGGIASSIAKQSTFEECWFDGTINTTLRDCGGIVDEILEARVNMRHCLFSGEINMPYDYAGTRTGGLCGRVESTGTLIIQDCLASGKINAEHPIYTGGILGSSYSGTQITIRETYLSMDTYGTVIGEYGANGAFVGSVLSMESERLKGVSAYQWTTLDFENYWSAIEGSAPVLKRFAKNAISLDGIAKAYDVSWYNPNSYSFEISNAQQLYGMYIISAYENFSGKIIKLTADIEFNIGNAKDWIEKAPKDTWHPIASFAGIFDGQGHTISGLYSVESDSFHGFIAKATATSFIKNLSIKNSYFCNTNTSLSAVGSVAGETYGKLENIYSDAIVVAYGVQAGGLLGRANDNDSDGKEDKVTISNCWFDGSVSLKGENTTEAGGLVGYMVQGDLEIANCLNSGAISSEVTKKNAYIAGILGNGSYGENHSLYISDSMNVGKVVCADGPEFIGSIIGRLPKNKPGVYLKNVYATAESHRMTIGDWNRTGIHGGVIQLDESWFVGENGYCFTELDYDKYWALTKNGTPVLKMFANTIPSVAGIERKLDTSWYNEDKEELSIKNPAQLMGFAMVGMFDSFKGRTVKLEADIAMDSSIQWIPIGEKTEPVGYTFAGTFDGKGHTISGLYSESDQTYQGFFKKTNETSHIKNLRITDSYFCNTNEEISDVGSVAGEIKGKLENIYSDAIVVAYGGQAGGFVGRASDDDSDGKENKLTISNCWFDGSVTLKGKNTTEAGGLVGFFVKGDLEIANCLNSGVITSEVTKKNAYIAGLLGNGSYGENHSLYISDSMNVGKVVCADGPEFIGSIIGRLPKNKPGVYLKNVYATAESHRMTIGDWNRTGIHGGVIQLDESWFVGENGYCFTELDYDKYWALTKNGTPVLKMFANTIPSVAGIERKLDTSWYNEDKEELSIKNPAQLMGFAMVGMFDSFKGRTVKLEADIAMDSSIQWIPIGEKTEPVGYTFAGTFDGKGHTISGLYSESDQTYQGFFKKTNETSHIKNLRITDSYFCNTNEEISDVGSVAGEIKGKLENIYSDAIVVAYGGQAGGFVGRASDDDSDGKENKLTISNCWFDGSVTLKGKNTTEAGGLVGFFVKGDLEISNCLNSGTISAEVTDKDAYIAGLLGNGSYAAQGSLHISDSMNVGKVVCADGPEFIGSIIGRVPTNITGTYLKNVYATSESHKRTIGNYNTTGMHGSVTKVDEGSILGVEGYRYTELDFVTYWAARKNEVPGLKMFVKNALSIAEVKKPDISWYDDSENEFHLVNAEQFYGFTKLVNSGKTFADKIVYLDADIKLNKVKDGTVNAWVSGEETPDNPWIPIGNASNTFAGTFDGQMHTISGVYVNNGTIRVGLFGMTDNNSVIKKFYLKDSYFYAAGDSKSYAYLGSVVGECRGTIDTVYSDAILKSPAKRIGGIAGVMNTETTAPTINNCWFDGKIKGVGDNGTVIGGITSVVVQNTANITDSLFTGEITYDAAGDSASVGGLLGGNNWKETVNIEDCLAIGTMNGQTGAKVGAILGSHYKDATINMLNVYGSANNTVAIGNESESAAKNRAVLLADSECKGLAAYQNTLLDFEENWCARVGAVPALKSFAKVNAANTENPIIADFQTAEQNGWYRANITAYGISSTSAFKAFRDYTNAAVVNNFSGVTIYLCDDINLNPGWNAPKDSTEDVSGNPENWTPIGTTSSNRFKGTFDGLGHTISGLHMDYAENYAGLFGYCIETYTIRNFALTNSYIRHRGSLYTGSIIGRSDAPATSNSLSNIYSDAIIVTDAQMSGGIAGMAEGTVSECWFDGELKCTLTDPATSSLCMGGIVGSCGVMWGMKTLTIKDCLNTGKLIAQVANANATKGLGVGGILGATDRWGKPTSLSISNCVNAGTIDVSHENAVGAIAGRVYSNAAMTYAINNCYASNNCITSISGDDMKILGVATNATDSTATASKIVNASDFKGAQIYENTNITLDYTKWIARTNDTVIPKCFVGIVVKESDCTNQ